MTYLSPNGYRGILHASLLRELLHTLTCGVKYRIIALA
jgi:hypothetical protein